ncbi:MAG: L-2-amino-thiazoline-4-carboxylic acid hydrolase [Candidatus Thorarchaeota archaeon]|jgi:hypothetical protein
MPALRVCKANTFLPDSTLDVDISSVLRGVLVSLDRFLKYTNIKKPEILNEFISDLTEYYETLAEDISGGKRKHSLTVEELDILAEHPALIDACVNYVLNMYDLPDNFSLDSPMHKTTLLIHRRASLAPSLHRLKQFSVTANANWTNEFLQTYAEYFVEKYRRVPEHPDLEKVFDADAESFKTDKTSVCTGVLFDNSKYAYRVDKCMGHEALKEFNEPEFAYLAICAGDGAIVKKMNDNFEFTRTSTLMNGSYCDGIVHDTRYVDEVNHEPASFFTSLNDFEKE